MMEQMPARFSGGHLYYSDVFVVPASRRRFFSSYMTQNRRRDAGATERGIFAMQAGVSAPLASKVVKQFEESARQPSISKFGAVVSSGRACIRLALSGV